MTVVEVRSPRSDIRNVLVVQHSLEVSYRSSDQASSRSSGFLIPLIEHVLRCRSVPYPTSERCFRVYKFDLVKQPAEDFAHPVRNCAMYWILRRMLRGNASWQHSLLNESEPLASKCRLRHRLHLGQTSQILLSCQTLRRRSAHSLFTRCAKRILNRRIVQTVSNRLSARYFRCIFR